jgi:amino acid transporter
MINFTFGDLIILDVMLYGAGLLLELVSLIALRIKEPGTYRPFKIPVGIAGLCVMMLLPFTLMVIALSGAFLSSDRSLTMALSALGALLFWKRKKPLQELPV